MKKTFLLLSLSLLLFACSSGPEKTARNFTENMAKGKVKEAKKYATESAGQLLDLAVSFGGMTVHPDFKFKMEKDSIVGDKAWVTYKGEEGELETLELVKIDGDWLVHLDDQK